MKLGITLRHILNAVVLDSLLLLKLELLHVSVVFIGDKKQVQINGLLIVPKKVEFTGEYLRHGKLLPVTKK